MYLKYEFNCFFQVGDRKEKANFKFSEKKKSILIKQEKKIRFSKKNVFLDFSHFLFCSARRCQLSLVVQRKRGFVLHFILFFISNLNCILKLNVNKHPFSVKRHDSVPERSLFNNIIFFEFELLI
jgi:hypothetical protein